MNSPQTADLHVARHFMILVYPFRHGLSARPSARQLTRLGECWRPWFSRLDRENLERALDDTYFFLARRPESPVS